MRSPKVLALLAAALLVLVGAAGAIGLVSLSKDVERARLRYVERAANLANSLCDALDAVQRELPSNEQGFVVRAALDGALIEPAPTEPAAARERRVRDAELVGAVMQQVDALDREGQAELGDTRLAELAERADRPNLAAFALSWLAARAERDGRTGAAHEHWQQVAARFPDERDERDLAFGFVARAELLMGDDADVEGLVALHADLLADVHSSADSATLALADRVAQRVARIAPTRSSELTSATAAARRPLALVSSWSRGPSEWIARGAPSGAELFELDGAAPLLVAALRDAGADTFTGRALELERAVALALARLEPGELAVAVTAADGTLLAGSAVVAGAPSSTLRARAPLESLSVTAFGPDFERFAASERQRFRLVAGVFIGALLAAAGAGFAIVRSVTRDARRAAEREAFVAAVTHELKTPIASIRLLAELLERGDVDAARVREFGQRTVRESVRLGRLIDSILEFARVQRSGEVERDSLEVVDVGGALAEALASVAPLAQERGFELRLAAVPAGLSVFARRDAFVGAAAELIENATKYGAPAGGVDVAVRTSGARVCVEVDDRGPGVPVSEETRVFEPFRRLGDELTRERAGIGLGLALVKGSIEAAGGSVGYTPRPGGGARFWIELDLAGTTAS